MARPITRGLAYFPLDTGIFGDRKILRLLDKYGCEGTMVYLLVLCEIYASEGYYIPFGQDLFFDIGFTLRMDETLVEEILSFCVSIRLFDNEWLKRDRVLSSEGIRKRYAEIMKRVKRRNVDTSQLINPIMEVSEVKVEVSPVKTPTKGKGNINKKKEEQIKKEERYETKTQQSSAEDGDVERQAALRRMLEAAKTGK